MVFLVSMFLLCAALAATWPTNRAPAPSSAVYDRIQATVSERTEVPCGTNECVSVEVQLSSGKVVDLGTVSATSQLGSLPIGESVVLGFEPDTGWFFYQDLDRRTELLTMAIVFAFVVLIFARLRGLRSLASLLASALLLYFYTAPALIAGSSPILICAITAAAIIALSSLFSHGFSASSQVACVSMLLALLLTLALTAVVFPFFAFTGFLSEDVLLVRSALPDLDLAGIVFGSILIGFVGALDDVVLTQVASVFELSTLSSRRTVFTSALRIGRTHVAASVNTLAMAYLSASMPLLLLFAISASPVGLVLSGELVAIEMVRMFVGTMGLMAAVPVSTALATLVYTTTPRH